VTYFKANAGLFTGHRGALLFGFFRREQGDDFVEPRITAQRIPDRTNFQLKIR
jgi:hypothetical protein